MLAHRILFGEEALDEGLVDHSNLRRSCRVLLGNAAAAHHGHANGIEKMRSDAIPGRAAIIAGARRGMTLLDDALAPVVAFQRAIERHADVGHARQRGEAVFDLAIERGQTVDGIAGASRIEMQHVAVGSGDTQLLMFQVGQRFGHQDGSGEQNQGERSLKYDQRFLRQRGAVSCGAIDASQRLGRLCVRRQPRRPRPEHHTRKQ